MTTDPGDPGHEPVLPDAVLAAFGLGTTAASGPDPALPPRPSATSRDGDSAGDVAAVAINRVGGRRWLVYADLTLGRGGHAALVAEAVRRRAIETARRGDTSAGVDAGDGIKPAGLVIVGFDLDRENLAYAGARLMQEVPGIRVLSEVAPTAGGAAEAVRSTGGSRGVPSRADLNAAVAEVFQPVGGGEGGAPVSPAGMPVIALLFHANFVEAPDRLRSLGLAADLLLADFGFASNQVDDPARGMSFRDDGPLDMRLDRNRQSITAADIVNQSSEQELADLIEGYGEEPWARKVAKRILAERRDGPILTTTRLAQVVESAYGARARQSRMHPATRTFMALRIAVNDELGNIESLLRALTAEAVTLKRTLAARAGAWPLWLAPGARIALICFHSLEDRPVKQAFAELTRSDAAMSATARALTRKPVTASEAEIARNPRSRSAKMRAIALADGRGGLEPSSVDSAGTDTDADA